MPINELLIRIFTMKIRLFTIPNLLTLANLLCGSLAVIAIATAANYKSAFLLIVLAAVFDFFDGFAARILNQCSPLGGELDSLADMISFGLAPALVMMSLTQSSEWLYLSSAVHNSEVLKYGAYIPLLIAAFSALRLAKFNIDEAQSCEFIGLPTPACALFCVSLGLLYTEGFALSAELVVAIALVLALLLISPIKMFALKFKGFGWRNNEIRYGFIALSVALFALLQLHALPLIVVLYVALSTILHICCKRCS